MQGGRCQGSPEISALISCAIALSLSCEQHSHKKMAKSPAHGLVTQTRTRPQYPTCGGGSMAVTMGPFLFLVAATISTNSTNANDTSDDSGFSSNHILPTVLVLSVLGFIAILLACYCLRFKNQRKADITTVDKKIPNGILEEQ
ncbi:hypothetical protein NFI96_031944, partial [Prochilodus magdalenae]